MTHFPAMTSESIRCVPSACRSGMAGGIFPSCRYLGVRVLWSHARRNRTNKGRQWWNRPDVKESDILKTLRAAYRAYRTKAKALHPDHLNGERKEWDRLNFAWQNVRRAFARRGYTV